MNQGWQCPVCRRVYGPFVPECGYCNQHAVGTTYGPKEPKGDATALIDPPHVDEDRQCKAEHPDGQGQGILCERCGKWISPSRWHQPCPGPEGGSTIPDKEELRKLRGEPY